MHSAIHGSNTARYALTDARFTLVGTADYGDFGIVRSQSGTSLALGYTAT